MCQLLGMNSAVPTTDFRFNLKGFCERGGRTDVHAHGFGLCLYNHDDQNNSNGIMVDNEGFGGAFGMNGAFGLDGDVNGSICDVDHQHQHQVQQRLRTYRDILPACESPVAEFIQKQPFHTQNMISHIRYATQGKVSYENVHPFTRTWNNIEICFCHNGECPAFTKNRHHDTTTKTASTTARLLTESTAWSLPTLGKTQQRQEHQMYSPTGETDSEAVFCSILNAMDAEFAAPMHRPSQRQPPKLYQMFDFMQSICDEIVSKHPQDTIFNFLLGYGPYTQFAYSWPGRRPGSQVWNGLHYRMHCNHDDDDHHHSDDSDRVALIATKPLTKEPGWIEFQRGELLMFHKGHVYRRKARRNNSNHDISSSIQKKTFQQVLTTTTTRALSKQQSSEYYDPFKSNFQALSLSSPSSPSNHRHALHSLSEYNTTFIGTTTTGCWIDVTN